MKLYLLPFRDRIYFELRRSTADAGGACNQAPSGVATGAPGRARVE